MPNRMFIVVECGFIPSSDPGKSRNPDQFPPDLTKEIIVIKARNQEDALTKLQLSPKVFVGEKWHL